MRQRPTVRQWERTDGMRLGHRERTSVPESLANALAGPLDELVGSEAHPVGVSSVVTAAVLEHHGQGCGIIGLIFVDEDFENRRGRHELGLHDSLTGLVRTDLVHVSLARHAEGDDDGAPITLDEVLGRHGEVLEPRDGLTDDGEGLAVSRARLEFCQCSSTHVVPGEHGVNDTNLEGRLKAHNATLIPRNCHQTVTLNRPDCVASSQTSVDTGRHDANMEG